MFENVVLYYRCSRFSYLEMGRWEKGYSRGLMIFLRVVYVFRFEGFVLCLGDGEFVNLFFFYL